MSSQIHPITTTIDAQKKGGSYLVELFRHYELLYFFTWRDVLVRYKEAFFGVSWAIIRPLLYTILFSFFFGKVAKLPSNDIYYPLFIYAGLLPWQLFANATAENCLCLINNRELISKVYFPKMVLPLSQVAVQLVDFGVNFLLFFFLAWLWAPLSVKTLLVLPYYLGLMLLFCMGTSLWFSAVTVQYRDMKFVVPFIIQFGMFISPVCYGSFVISGTWKWLFSLNPMVGIIDGFRYAFFGMTHPDFLPFTAIASVMTFAIFISGFLVFRQMERTFADKI